MVSMSTKPVITRSWSRVSRPRGSWTRYALHRDAASSWTNQPQRTRHPNSYAWRDCCTRRQQVAERSSFPCGLRQYLVQHQGQVHPRRPSEAGAPMQMCFAAVSYLSHGDESPSLRRVRSTRSFLESSLLTCCERASKMRTDAGLMTARYHGDGDKRLGLPRGDNRDTTLAQVVAAGLL